MIGENRKLLIFRLEQVPELGRGAGVILQRYKDGVVPTRGVSARDGLTWRLGERVRTETDLRPWLAEAGHLGICAERVPADAKIRRLARLDHPALNDP